jgi:putative transposase
MERRQAFQFELMPNGEQQRQMSRSAGCAGYVYNKALALKQERYEKKEKLTRFQLDKMLVQWKQETPWLAEAPCHALQQAILDLERADANFFQKRAKFPKFHKKGLRDSFRESDPNHAVVFIEDLQVKNRSASAKGRKAKPGKQVRQKSGLNRSILDASPFELRRQLEYKTQWNGGLLVAVPPQNTSRRCPECRHPSAQNRNTQTNFVCVECGFCAHADWVGAINIKEAGLASLACSSSSHAANASCQEPTEGMVCVSVQPVGIPSVHRGEDVNSLHCPVAIPCKEQRHA